MSFGLQFSFNALISVKQLQDISYIFKTSDDLLIKKNSTVYDKDIYNMI